MVQQLWPEFHKCESSAIIAKTVPDLNGALVGLKMTGTPKDKKPKMFQDKETIHI